MPVGADTSEEPVAPLSRQRLSGILFNRQRYTILALLLNNPDRQYSIADINDRVGVSRPVISSFISELQDIGLVEKERKGNLYLITLNQNSPYLPVLKNLLELDAAPLQDAAQALADDINEDGIRSIYLFGSVARGTPRTDSDIDLLIVTVDGLDEQVRDRIVGIVNQRSQELGISFSLTWYEQSELDSDRRHGVALLQRIASEGIHLAGEEQW